MAANKVLRKIAKAKQAVLDAVRHGAIMYANGKGGRPIVDQHFTAGNQARYGWPPLSRAYFLWKQGLLKSRPVRLNKAARSAIESVKFHRRSMRRKLFKGRDKLDVVAARAVDKFDQETKRAVSEVTAKVTPKQAPRTIAAKGVKLDKNAGFWSDLGDGKRGEGTAKNLPMLVLSGDLRKTANSKGHTVTMRGGDAVITFRNLTEYATYLHEGTPRMPKRSPVEPGEEDKRQVLEHMKAYIRRATGAAIK